MEAWNAAFATCLRDIKELQAADSPEQRESLRNQLAGSQLRLENAKLAVAWHRDEHGCR
jgi:hypothetical protein